MHECRSRKHIICSYILVCILLSFRRRLPFAFANSKQPQKVNTLCLSCCYCCCCCNWSWLLLHGCCCAAVVISNGFVVVAFDVYWSFALRRIAFQLTAFDIHFKPSALKHCASRTPALASMPRCPSASAQSLIYINILNICYACAYVCMCAFVAFA